MHPKTLWFKLKRQANKAGDLIENSVAFLFGLFFALLKGLWQLIKNARRNMKSRSRLFAFSVVFLLSSIFFYVWTLWFFIELSTFSAALLKAAVGYGLFAIIDEFVWGKVDTLTELVTNQNIAYALYFVAIAIIYAAALATA